VNETQTPYCRQDPDSNVLVISQAPDFVRLVLETLARRKILGLVADNADAALDLLDKNDCSLVFIADCVPRKAQTKAGKDEAFELLAGIKNNFPQLPVVMVANNDDRKTQSPNQMVEWAVLAMYAGCRDFLVAPVSGRTIEKLLDTFVPNRPSDTIASAEQGAACLFKIVGKSPSLIQTVNLARKVAPTAAPVLISGESGSGKELISYVVHYASARATGPFVKVNCAALSETLLESELFGHERGAFTGAYAQRKGRFEMAHGGTLLLDEISETPLRFQAKLLRVLEQQDFQRVGGNDNVKVDVRIISTTNKDLLQQIASGEFRQDLYYRLCGVRLMVTPLRQRKEDLESLIWHFINLYAGQAGRKITRLDRAMMEMFSKYHWPGNVRQLRNVVFTSLALGSGDSLSIADVSWLFDELQPLPEIQKQKTEDRESKTDNVSSAPAASSSSELAGIPLAELERQAILETLRQTKGNQLMAARSLGISDRTLRDKIKRYRRQGCLQPA
jgi:DNA-binding NtrC family response regulator